jgi:ferrous iron transport protein B
MVLTGTPTIALVGNPNTGKTTLFNALAGMRQRVGNYPGVTVESKKGRLTHQGLSFDVVDLPGTYSLAPRSPDEMVAVDLLLGQQPGERRPDVVLAIVDASNLERHLYLVTQLMELGVPVVVALNMIDVAEGQGIHIDADLLTRKLGVPVVPIQANKGIGLDVLKVALAEAVGTNPSAHGPAFPPAFERELANLREAVGGTIPPFLLRRLLLDVGGSTEQRCVGRYGQKLKETLQDARLRLRDAGCAVPAVEARARYAWIRENIAGCVRRPDKRAVTWTDRIDRILTHRVWGVLIFLAVMFVVFQSIFTWAKPAMEWINQGQDALADGVKSVLPPGMFRSLLTKGVIKGVGSVLVFLPQILILFGFIALLEDCGYMARAAYLMDKLMARCGLNGKSFIPMLSSMACAVPGIMAARVIENRRDRLTTILVAPLMSCSARLPVYTLLIAAFLSPPEGATWREFSWWVPGLTLFFLYMIGLVVAPLVALALKRTLLRGETPVFVMEMPLYKRPSLRTVGHRMFQSGWLFVRRAGTLILASMIVIWALLYFPSWDAEGGYETWQAELEQRIEEHPEHKEKLDDELNDLQARWTRGSILGQVGRAIEPAVRPLGWDWRIGMAALASFPAREVMVATLGLIYNQGEAEPGEEQAARYRAGLARTLREQRWDDDPGRLLFTVPVALSVMVFFALCCQCASTLAVIRRETGNWWWPAFTFAYMTVLAYLGALVVYQIGSLLV